MPPQTLYICLFLIFIAGIALGAFVNWATYRWAWKPRAIGPWIKPHPKALPRKLSDRIPVYGWFGLAREEAIHGKRFWIRPILVEFGLGLFLAWLYHYEVVNLGLILFSNNAPPGFVGTPLPNLHPQYFFHAGLIVFMLIASLIDLDEKTIPDLVTIPGTLLALAFSYFFPHILLPDVAVIPPVAPGAQIDLTKLLLDHVHAWTPLTRPDWVPPSPNAASLYIAWGCFAFWCFALFPRVVRLRKGWKIAYRLFVRYAVHDPMGKIAPVLLLIGAPAIWWCWKRGGPGWESLLTSLIGMTISASIIWSIRVVGKLSLGREAMGFGDVTLMAMLGAALGWQACVIVFFLSPLVALVAALANWFFHREHEIPYGPFLCMAALFVVITWKSLWQQTMGIFELGGFLPIIFVGCLFLMGLMLLGIRAIRSWLAR